MQALLARCEEMKGLVAVENERWLVEAWRREFEVRK
jgi:hypothetical protein